MPPAIMLPEQPPQAVPYSRQAVLIFYGIWLCLALGASSAGLLQKVQAPLPQLLIFVLTNILLLLFWRNPQLHLWARQASIRAIVLIHTSRIFAGTAFLLLHAR